jgi:Flp pilus assembly protein protease CpaA
MATNPLIAALGVKDVNKTTICNWFLFWLCIALAVAVASVAMFAFTLATGRAALAWGMVPSLLLVTVVVASNYFVYAMCSKLPEGFRA